MPVSPVRLCAVVSLLLFPLGSSRAQAEPPPKQLQQQLLHAVVQNQIETVQTLLKQGGDPNGRIEPAQEDAWILRLRPADDPTPPLIVLACRYGSPESKAIRLLLDRGADVNLADKNGVTPLMAASELDWDPSVALLLEHRANVNARDNNGKTALMYAMGNFGLSTAAKLLAKRADINARDNDRKTPLMYAILNAVHDPIWLYGEDMTKKAQEEKVRYRELVQFMIDNKADVNAIDKVGNTPLKLATAMHQAEIVKMLIRVGAKR